MRWVTSKIPKGPVLQLEQNKTAYEEGPLKVHYKRFDKRDARDVSVYFHSWVQAATLIDPVWGASNTYKHYK